jgi:MFS family permease
MAIASQLVGRLYHSVGPRRLMITGLTTLIFVTLPFVWVGFGTSLWVIRALMFARGICMAFAFVPLQASSYANIAPEDTGRASAIYTAQRQVAASLGVAILATVLIEATHHFNAGVTSASAAAQGGLDAFHLTFFVSSVLIVFAALSALLIRDEDAASTIRRFQEVESSAPHPAPALEL